MAASENVFRWLPCPVVFICTNHEDRRDIMTATALFVSEKEPLVTVSVGQGHLTDQLISASGEFTLVIASTGQKKLAVRLGSTRGGSEDKYEKFGIATLAGDSAPPGIPAASAAWMKCRVEQRQAIPGYSVWTARVVAQDNLEKAPLVWHEDAFFGLSKI